jgi:hypothetical protein
MADLMGRGSCKRDGWLIFKLILQEKVKDRDQIMPIRGNLFISPRDFA